jgi:hypothetical protein
MDDPLFLQEMENHIYKQDTVKSIDQIITDYLGKNPTKQTARLD